MQLMKAYEAEMSCNQAVIGSNTYMLKISLYIYIYTSSLTSENCRKIQYDIAAEAE